MCEGYVLWMSLSSFTGASHKILAWSQTRDNHHSNTLDRSSLKVCSNRITPFAITVPRLIFKFARLVSQFRWRSSQISIIYGFKYLYDVKRGVIYHPPGTEGEEERVWCHCRTNFRLIYYSVDVQPFILQVRGSTYASEIFLRAGIFNSAALALLAREPVLAIPIAVGWFREGRAAPGSGGGRLLLRGSNFYFFSLLPGGARGIDVISPLCHGDTGAAFETPGSYIL